ncbi:MAG: iron-containing alcohol dehydrogenase [Planctomycetes bacterium]|nr:iron-containing alcohol dehydrogenase [Planctomycetota bacterium]
MSSHLLLRLDASESVTHIVVGESLAAADLAVLAKASTLLPIVDGSLPASQVTRGMDMAAALGERCLQALVLPGGEGVKDLGAFATHVEAALARHPDRRTRVLVIGGGAVLDCGQFLAAVLLRGLECCVVPTTLLAQVDAAVGGKCGLDVGARKNQVGVIRQPAAVFVDTAFLSTLPARQIQSGLAELAKTALLCGGVLHAELLAHAQRGGGVPSSALVAACLEYKASVVQRDPLERGERVLLNAGHSVGHALEAAALEAGIDLPHGHAVALGLRAEARAFAPQGVVAVDALLDALNMPRAVPVGVDCVRAAVFLDADKKRQGASIRIPVFDAPGVVRIVEVDMTHCAAALHALALH